MSSQPAIAVRVLGPLVIERVEDGARVLSQPRRAALFCYLALAEPRGPHARDRLVELFWPEVAAESGRRSLRNALHELRAEVGAGVVVTEGKHHVRLDPALVRIDLDELDRRLKEHDITWVLEHYAEPFTGFYARGADEFERWLEALRSRCRTRVVEAVRRAAAAARTRDPRTAAGLWAAARGLEPDDESLLREELTALAEAGDPVAVQRTYAAFAQRLADELGVRPGAATVGLVTRLAARPPGRTELTIALIPLGAAGADEGTELARALDDGVRRRLARLAGVRVIARSAVRTMQDEGHSALEIGRRLGAELVASGTLLLTPDGTMRLALEVMEASDGRLVRDLRHDAPRHDLFAAEGVLAAGIVPPLDRARLGVDDHDRSGTALPAPQRPQDNESYLQCLRGHWLFLRAAHVGGSAADLELSRECFEQSLALDPGYGAAYAGLSNYFAVCAARGLRSPFEETFSQAIALSHRALEIDPSLAVPHVHFGVRALYLERDWSTAEREFRAAVRLDPEHVEALRFLGVLLTTRGEMAEGLAALREAVRLEPHMPIYRNSLADALLGAGALDEAAGELVTALQLDPRYRAAADRLTRCHERGGRFAEAIAVRREHGDGAAAARFAEHFARDGAEGYRRERRRELEQFVATLTERLAASASAPASPADRFAPPELALALAYAELGRWDDAWRCESVARARGQGPWFARRAELAPLAPRRETVGPPASATR